ncbi:hypothetical protein BDA99DRAFT_444766 [Phascolomyces articulosus]|uniref:Uncharacterized protein n=1 Tax=Phascolomyces articulosus TaxID=60185 RepID=A0AAD5K153_9FUNG|nr:hypothetical protein BDA99DRAFT_444766 [Phascolomyces articulosus]
MVATLKELLEKQKFLLKNLQVEKQHCQSDNKALSKRIQVVTTESRHRTKDIEQLRKRGVDTLVMLLKGEKVKNISKKIQQLQQDIHTLASSLLEQCDTDVATKAFSIFWLNLKEPIAAMGDPLPLKRILTLTEKFMMDVLVDLFILNENPGFNIQEKYHQLSVWIYDNATDPEDTYLGGLLRQEIARICDRCRKDKTSDLYQTHCEVLQNKWKYMYSGLVKAFPFVYQNDKAEPDIKKHYGARVHSLVEQAIDIGMSIRSQAMDIYAVAVEEGTQALDTGMMLDVDGHTSGTIALCIFPPILASAPISSDVDTSLVLAVGRMLCI